MAHPWRFFRAGDFDQVFIDSGEDIRALGELDQKLWVALACPTKGVEFDPHTLELLDTDKDGRIRAPEVLAAAKWTCSVLKNPNDLLKGESSLPLSAISEATEEGRTLLAATRQILVEMGKADAIAVLPSDAQQSVQVFSKAMWNGDGLVPPEGTTGDPVLASLVKDMTAVGLTEKDSAGRDCVSLNTAENFFTQAKNYLEWSQQSGKPSSGIDLAGAHAAFKEVEAKVTDYFARCALAEMDSKAASALAPSDADYQAITKSALSAKSESVKAMPIARPEAGRALPLSVGVNPAWAIALSALRTFSVKPLLGEKSELTLADWENLTSRFSEYSTWQANKPSTVVEKLGVPRLTELVASDARARLETLVKKDLSLKPQADALSSVDRLAHLYRDLAGFLNNFVAFRDFYTRKDKGIFQVGTLYLDGKSCELCLRVEDVGAHSALATMCMAYLAYCECSRKGSAEKVNIVAAFTGGDADFLTVGRKGVFYDRKGQDYDATIVKLVEQPISVRQAMWAPYRRAARFVNQQIEKFAAEEDKKSTVTVETGVGKMAAGAKEQAKEKGAPFDVAKFAGVFAAIGLALGAIGTAGAAILSGLLGLRWWQMPLAGLGAMAIISGPSVLLATLKLRQRNLAPLLDASGWAINARAKLNIPFGGSLTGLATLPKGALRNRVDPFAQKRRPWWLYIALTILAISIAVTFHHGYLDDLWRALKRLWAN